MRAGRTCCQRYSTRFGKDDALNFPLHASAEGTPEFRALPRTKIGNVVEYAKKSKIGWAGHVMRYSDDRWSTNWIPRDVERTPGQPSERYSHFFTKALD
ncbi:unnamed protein product [Haemonchus placei]|uniref:Chromo domain-containing protein n=1 Tax=Haemonchus placei TaxID=6290 RepID=A0A0N4WH75_HAEPC|nr:unnamed protein product [Haemonchus placei]